ncbi:MAG: hypothetical protein J2P48_08285 [Alphaproteobacteria bacterium]|nr:hypothetical protein [Alphaproteobacteria bacterium]
MDIDLLWKWFLRNRDYVDYMRAQWEGQNQPQGLPPEPPRRPEAPQSLEPDLPVPQPELPPHQVSAGPFTAGPPRRMPDLERPRSASEQYRIDMKQGAR